MNAGVLLAGRVSYASETITVIAVGAGVAATSSVPIFTGAYRSAGDIFTRSIDTPTGLTDIRQAGQPLRVVARVAHTCGAPVDRFTATATGAIHVLASFSSDAPTGDKK